jgi:uncharacterized repeat protein (TIGR01451 family)/uncharacterized repeat protein (TIGR02543 family)
MAKQTAVYNTDTVLNENAFTKTGSTFVKWTTDAAGESTYYDDKDTVKLTDNLTLYAQWDVAKSDVTYSYENSIEGVTLPELPAGRTDVEYGTEVTVADAPGLPGYVFEGWNTDDVTVTDNKFDMPDHDVEFTGSWRKRQQNIDVGATKTVDVESGDKLSYGDTITFTITVTNNGTDDSDPITIVDQLLADSPITTSASATPDGVSVTGSLSDGGIVVGSIPAGESVVVTITVTVEGEGAVPGQTVSSQSTIYLNDDQENHVIYHDEEPITEMIETEVSFVQKTPNTKGYNIIVLVDESGSMGYKTTDCNGNFIKTIVENVPRYGSFSEYGISTYENNGFVCTKNPTGNRYTCVYDPGDGYCADESNNPIPISRFVDAKAATKTFIDMIFPSVNDNTNNSKLAVYTFGSRNNTNYANIVGSVVGNYNDVNGNNGLKDKLDDLNDYPYNSATPYKEAFTAAKDALNSLKSNGNENIVVFLTDGENTGDNYDSQVTSLKNLPAKIYSIGFGVGASEMAVLNNISNQTGGTAYESATTQEDLERIFGFIKAALDVPKEEWTEQGVTEMTGDFEVNGEVKHGTVQIDSSHPLTIYVNNQEFKKYTSDPTADTSIPASERYIYKDLDGKYDVDASLFPAGSSIKVVYYVTLPGGSKMRMASANVKLRSVTDSMSESELNNPELELNVSITKSPDDIEMPEEVGKSVESEIESIKVDEKLNETIINEAVDNQVIDETANVAEDVTTEVVSSENIVNNETEVEKQEVIVEEVEEEIIDEEVKTSEPVEETKVEEQEIVVEETEEDTTKEEAKTSEPVEETEEETVGETVPSEESKVENVESTESNSNETEVEE